MKRLWSVQLIFLFTSTIAFGAKNTDFVNPFIGTAGDHGQLDPAATVPFGMVKLGPDTQPGNHGGYDFEARLFKGFSHNRFSGVGCRGAGGNLRILPNIGESPIAEIDKATEIARPGYYAAGFTNGVAIELTATNYTGFHRYIFPESSSATITFDAKSSFAGIIDASISPINDHEFFVEISARNVCGYGRYSVFYHVWTNRSLRNHTINDNLLRIGFASRQNEPIMIKVTASSIGLQDAQTEFRRFAKQQSFDEVRRAALAEWENWLSRIDVTGEPELRTLFYTSLYRTLLNPVRDGNRVGDYRATDGRIRNSGKYKHYAGWSMWDNFRNKFSLIALLDEGVSSDIGNSLVDLYRNGKATWSGIYEPVPNVRTEHSIITLLDLHRRGVPGIDLAAAYGPMMTELINTKASTPDSILELSYDFWALSRVAEILDKPSDARLFSVRALSYRKMWRERFLPITEKSDIMHGDGLYEGTLWQYRWHVQFDLDGMIEMLGGKKVCAEQLEYFFENALYNHGNQPDLHAVYLFNFCDRPELTQRWTNRVLTGEMSQWYGTHEKWKRPYVGRIYRNHPRGYIPEMDDDDGTMSAWFVLSAIGIYPVVVGEPEFQITSPIFDKITLRHSNGRNFVIKTVRPSAKSIYIDRIDLNGRELDATKIDHKKLISSGEMVFHLSER